MGSQVLGVNVYGHYYTVFALSVVNYVSIILASIIFFLIFAKYYRFATIQS